MKVIPVNVRWLSLLHTLHWCADHGSYEKTDTNYTLTQWARLRTYCLYCQNVTSCHGTRVRVTTLTETGKVQFSLYRFSFLRISQVLNSIRCRYVLPNSTQNLTINVEIMERIFIHAFNKVGHARSRFSWNSCSSGSFYWKFLHLITWKYDKPLSGWHQTTDRRKDRRTW
jgi:hypothetical protein